MPDVDLSTILADGDYLRRDGDDLIGDPGHRSPYIDIRDLGAVGDGTTNDSAAFVAALADGRPVLIPEGTYLLDEISIPANSTMFGVGDGSIVKRRDPTITQQRVFYLNGNNIHLHDFKIDGNGHVGEWNCGLIQSWSGGLTNIRLENLTLQDGSGEGVQLTGLSQITIRGCRIINTGSGAFFINGPYADIADVIISDNYIDRTARPPTDTATGICVRGSNDHTFVLRRVTITNNIVRQIPSTTAAICIEAWGTEIAITGNVTTGGLTGISTAGNLGNGHDHTVSANSVSGALCGIELAAGGGRAVCAGNSIRGAQNGINQSAAGTDEVDIVGNVLTGITGHGIYLAGTRRCNITGNYVSLSTPFITVNAMGIRLQSLGTGTPLAHAVVSGNYLDGASTGDGANTSGINLLNITGSGDPAVTLAITGNTVTNFVYGVIMHGSGVSLAGTIVGNNVDTSVFVPFQLSADGAGTITGLILSANRGDTGSLTTRQITQAAYDALAVKNPAVLYVIVG